MSALISPIDVIGNDPIGRALEKIKIKPWQAGLLSLSWFLMYTLLLPAIFGVLFSRIGLERSSIDDRVNQVGFWIVHPIVLFFYVWQAQALSKLYDIVIPLAPDSMEHGLVRSAQILHRTRRWWVFGFLAGTFVVVLGLVFIRDYIGIRWYSINWLMAILLQASRFALFYMIVVIVIRHLICAANINRVYVHVALPVLIRHSRLNKAFDAITSYGFGFAGLCGALGLFIAMRFLYSIPVFPEDLIYLLAYIILIPFSFLLPFWQAHVNMQLARDTAIDKISNELQDEYDRLLNKLPAQKPDLQENNRIQVLRSMLDMAEKSPTWPFENLTIYRLIAAVISPFLLTASGYALDRFLR